MNKPNLFIVGSAKSGTTSVYSYLEKHPDVFMPSDEINKEPAFFSNKNKSMGMDYYLGLFTKSGTHNYSYFGEASTAYLTDITSAQRIYDFNPDSKIIILLRNPVDRANSLYNWMVQEGHEYSSSFKKALDREGVRSKKKIPNFFEPEYFWNYQYFSSGLYYKQVKRYIDIFGFDKVKILIFEDFIKNTDLYFQTICSYLNIEYKRNLKIENFNKSCSVYSPLFMFLIRKCMRIANIFSVKYETKNQRDKLLLFFQRNKKPKNMTDKDRVELLALYKDDISLLENLINKDFSVWK